MNLNVPDFSVVSRFFGGLLNELRQKRLWPVAVVLLAALVAVPVFLSKSSNPAPTAQTPLPAPPPSAATSLPALNVQSSQPHSNLNGRAHNPFGSSTSSSTTSSSTSVTSSAATTASSTANSTTSTLTGGTSAGGSASSSGSSAPTTSGQGTSSPPPSITPNAKPKPAPSGLTPTQAYDVSMAITNSSGGVDTEDPLQRLSVVPSDQQPLLVELGVAQDGNHVLFAVQHGAVPSGPAKCIPGPIDCEIISLGQDQTEQLSAQTGTIGASQVALFAITGITAADYPSASAADKARRAQSAAGRRLLNASTYPTLSLFQYEPSQGSVVDLRTLGVS